MEACPLKKLNPIDDAAALASVALWTYDVERSAISRSFKFADFAHAFAFMTQIAITADKRDHHPEWFNVYNRVDITLTTHDISGLSQRDIDLAKYADAAYAGFAVAAPAAPASAS
jgi:4a-hydroxytetrahydrobiopterin dehydratase